ncbi:hypothetical protein [Breoghania sp. JC706]|uniref:hypothetical protein n=1 Tax=Breoghania sp. JC706 TaxID=3117732 RepID=UPI0030084668
MTTRLNTRALRERPERKIEFLLENSRIAHVPDGGGIGNRAGGSHQIETAGDGEREVTRSVEPRGLRRDKKGNQAVDMTGLFYKHRYPLKYIHGYFLQYQSDKNKAITPGVIAMLPHRAQLAMHCEGHAHIEGIFDLSIEARGRRPDRLDKRIVCSAT